MKYLSELTPAEILLITNKNATQKELLKITLIDLLLKKVLTTVEIEKNEKFYDYIEIGNNFRNYPSKNHENIFLFIFKSDQNLKILFKNLVKVGYQKSQTSYKLKNLIITTSKLKECISQNFFQRIFSTYSYTKYGEELKRKILLELEQLNKEISSINNIDNRKAIELIAQIGGSIFLVGNINYDLLNQIEAELTQEINKNNQVESGCYGCSFGSYSSNFDSGCSSDSGGSGCGSGDSGGSGCSGCGGGGCGGGGCGS